MFRATFVYPVIAVFYSLCIDLNGLVLKVSSYLKYALTNEVFSALKERYGMFFHRQRAYTDFNSA